ncbi:MAG: nicotinamide mononucleotide transporter [Clostridia bacterium]|nr:nicotinamide mononucleotide transporter [Clostridia bacterium]
MKKPHNPFRDLSRLEWVLWIGSLLGVGCSYLFSPTADLLSMLASLIGVTALIFVAKGYVLGQVLTVVFAAFYGIISFHFQYYGEMITYLGMTAPMAVVAVISWLRHPYEESAEVAVHHLSRRAWLLLSLVTALVTAAFYFLLALLGNANLIVSTVSVTTSFLASALTFLRSPYYALAYAANDIVLIVLWIAAAMRDISYIPMVICFVMFFLNDMYGLYNWRRMARRQRLKMIEPVENVNNR